MGKFISRLRREPVALRGLLAAVLNVLVVGGAIDAGTADAIDETVVKVVEVAVFVAGNAALVLGARSRVTPTE